MTRHLAGILAALASLILSSIAFGAEFRVVQLCLERSCPANLYIIGKIEPGDGARFREVVRRTGPGIEALILRSVGGSMHDSIEIGTLASDLMLNTFAPHAPNWCPNDDTRWGVYNAPCTCVSGCFLIWMGGVNRYGTVVGMHRPWDTTGNMGQLPYEQAAQQYKKWLADLSEYLTRMELPDAYFSEFIATVKSGSMRMLTGRELLELNHNPSKTEWLTNRCGQWITQENDELGNLNFQKYRGLPHDSRRLQKLMAKLSAIQKCQDNAQREARTQAFKRIFGM